MQSSDSRRLNSWKEIATFLGRGERTVKRWEAENGLPVHRPVGKVGARIFAETAELNEWLMSSPAARLPAETPATLEPAEPTAAPPPRASRRPEPWMIGLAAALAIAAVALALGGARHRHGPEAAAAVHDPRAVDLYRQGVHDWNSRTPAGLVRAEDEFTQAIVHDPSYAEAYVGLANTYNLLREYAAMPDTEAYPRAEAAARRAIALDPSLASAHSALGFVLFYGRWDAAGAEAEFRKAVALDPNDALTHHWFANVLRCLVRMPEALKEIEIAQGLDPGSSAILADKANILESLGRVSEARQLLKQMSAVDPRFASPHAYLADFDLTPPRDYADFLVEARAAAGLHGDAARLAVLAAAEDGWTRGGAPAMLAAMLKAQKAANAAGQIPAYEVARTYVQMGDRAGARAWLRTSLRHRDAWIPYFAADPAMRVIAGDGDFAFARKAIKGGAEATQPPSG